YGENGIAVADIDGDGLDEIYVCQPGGLPNRLYHNDGKGHFRDVSKDFRLDLYFCTYVYFQSEAQYRYPTPYHDARNGPPNFLMRNRLDGDPPYFEDV